MLALYMLGAGLIVSGLFVLITWLGGRVIRKKGPTPGFIGAGLMALLSLVPMSYLLKYFLRLTQARGWGEGIYQLCFTAAVAIPIATGLSCSLLLLWAAFVARRRKRRRIRQRG
ncbi:hypothetical protein [Acaryochloris sp. IP29b_bin.148]|uniref:hypothetical protein n=1 Tax=Acaryochloris sp. IP29b_bin.148 TaxID=2969218 RepID=UPI00261E8DF3|nr:hypothetical protein [Acaryochloris sp. IP29b_bin.148]